MRYINTDYYLKVSFLLSIALIAAVFVMQFGFNILPCKLCLIQRYPYYFLLTVLALFYLLNLHNHKRLFVIIVVMSFLAAALIALYHSFVEFGYIETSLNCASSEMYQNVDDIKTALMGRPAVSCDAASFKIIGLTLSNWNFLIAALAFICGCCVIVKKAEKL